jgi:hypothetical protein
MPGKPYTGYFWSRGVAQGRIVLNLILVPRRVGLLLGTEAAYETEDKTAFRCPDFSVQDRRRKDDA